jgi:hypothetical protein
MGKNKQKKPKMELVSLFMTILDVHTRNTNFKPYLGSRKTSEMDVSESPQERAAKRSVFIRKPEVASGEKFKKVIPPNILDKTLSANIIMNETIAVEGVEEFSRKKIRQAV